MFNFTPVAGLTFLIHFRCAHARFEMYAVCSLEKTICLATATHGCHPCKTPSGNRELVSGPGTTEQFGCGLPHENKNNPGPVLPHTH
jgi:hypothetical protein